MGSRVGERGQITIEKAIREELAIYAGDETVQRVEDGRIVIEVVPGRHRRSLAGSLRDKVAGRRRRRVVGGAPGRGLGDAGSGSRRVIGARHVGRRSVPGRDADGPRLAARRR